ncbi:unnamed protein product [Cylicocyclus nassatus]|uniref:non-specific serine/threonine protein kinase n=1 Tax=Cylicocyclus nassatus TaxID=53992 RepID=A0AA36HH40_CYLNA|nr:unnamed protein product [Cylicocyclus nassatus]
MSEIDSPNTSRELKDLTECPVCLERFVQPVQLSCGHSFCNSCVERITRSGKVICPQCRHETSVPSEGLAISYRLKDLVALVSRVEEVGSSSTDAQTQMDFDEINTDTPQNGAQESDGMMMWRLATVFKFEILCAAPWGENLLIGADGGLMLCEFDRSRQSKVYELITQRRFEQLAVLKEENLLITISGKKRRIRIYNLSWLMQKLVDAKGSARGAPVQKRWKNLDDLQGAQHFKSVCYENQEYLVVGLEFSIIIYMWESGPHSKFVPFKSFASLPHSPLIVDLTLENHVRLKVLYASAQGFHAIDLDSSSIYDIHIPFNKEVVPRCIAVLPNSAGTQLVFCYDDRCVYVNTNGRLSKKVDLRWVDTTCNDVSVAYLSTGKVVSWGPVAIEIYSVNTSNLDIALMYEKTFKFRFMCEFDDVVFYTVAEPDGSSCRIEGIKGIQFAAMLQSKSENGCIRVPQPSLQEYGVITM